MKVVFWLAFVFLIGCALGGCSNAPGGKPRPPSKDESIQAALAKLSPEDRKLAEAQKYCAVQDKQRLGSMGAPIKVMIKDNPVFLCCGHCEEELKKDEEATLKKANQLKAAYK